jgi:hypothetical protein
MEKEIQELIRTNENDLLRWNEKRDGLRSKIKFCTEHKFEEEVRISALKLDYMEGIIYDYQSFINDLKIIIKSFENQPE